MPRLSEGLAILLVAILVVACSGGEGAGPSFPSACDESSRDGDCVEYTGAGWTEDEILAACGNSSLEEACPASDRVDGRCVIDAGTDFESVSYFYLGFWDEASAARACQSTPGAEWRSP